MKQQNNMIDLQKAIQDGKTIIHVKSGLRYHFNGKHIMVYNCDDLTWKISDEDFSKSDEFIIEET